MEENLTLDREGRPFRMLVFRGRPKSSRKSIQYIDELRSSDEKISTIITVQTNKEGSQRIVDLGTSKLSFWLIDLYKYGEAYGTSKGGVGVIGIVGDAGVSFKKLRKHSRNREGIHINLKGFGIGNGLTDPGIQYQAYTDFALANNVISKSDYDQINQKIPACEQAIKQCGTTGTGTCLSAFSICQQIFEDILSITGNINYYDIRKKCEGSLCYDFSNVENFLGELSVKTTLGVPSNIDFVSCSDRVYQAMINDWMRNLEVGIPALLEENIQLLIYAGEYDLICNWLGNWRWVHAMPWSGQKDFVAASNVSFLVDGKEAGILKNHGPLTFIKVHNAGHMVPMDQPRASLQMLELWTTGKLTPPKKGAIAPL